MSIANLTSYKKGVGYAGIKLFNILSSNVKSLNHDTNVFKPAWKIIFYLTPSTL
jgi:hypothetical protein